MTAPVSLAEIKAPLTVRVALMRGVEGPALVLLDGPRSGLRIAGPKYWGGGEIERTFTVSVSVSELRKAHRTEAKRAAKEKANG